jgi:hypothetical protein
MNINFCYSYRKRDIEHLLNLTDSFTWEELPTRDPDTGHLTQAGCIPITQTIATYVPTLVYVIHMAQGTMRIVTSRNMILPAWLPVDASVSPVYEIANLVQVIRMDLLIPYLYKAKLLINGNNLISLTVLGELRILWKGTDNKYKSDMKLFPLFSHSYNFSSSSQL